LESVGSADIVEVPHKATATTSAVHRNVRHVSELVISTPPRLTQST
jgi:hypothetical protein